MSMPQTQRRCQQLSSAVSQSVLMSSCCAHHVVVDGGNDGDWLLRYVDAGKDGGCLTDARQPLRQQLRRQVVQVQVQVVLVKAPQANREDAD